MFADMIYFIVALRMRGLQIYLKKLCQKEEYESISNHQYMSKNYHYQYQGVSLTSKQWSVKKMRICFIIKPTQTKWIQSILKTMFEFMLTQVIQAKAQSCEVFAVLQLQQLNTLFGDGLINFNKFFLKTLRLAAL